jgi:hypothetical protein
MTSGRRGTHRETKIQPGSEKYHPSENFIKLFFLNFLILLQNKIDCLLLASFLKASLILASRLWPYLEIIDLSAKETSLFMPSDCNDDIFSLLKTYSEAVFLVVCDPSMNKL